MFHQFDSNHDGILSADDVAAIFSIVPDPSLPPWNPVRAQAADVFAGCFSFFIAKRASSIIKHYRSSPRESDSGPMDLSQSLSASGITICSATSLPTVDIGMIHPVSKPMSFLILGLDGPVAHDFGYITVGSSFGTLSPWTRGGWPPSQRQTPRNVD